MLIFQCLTPLGSFCLLVLLLQVTTATSSSPSYPEIDPADIIERDVCIIGGGASGTYAAVRLRDSSRSVVVVERNDRLGGQTHTYADPINGGKVDIGVEVYQPLNVTRRFFSRFNVPLADFSFGASKPSPGDISSQHIDFRTGKTIANYTDTNNATDAALEAYATQVARYPYLASGFDLEYPVPQDLLLKFGDFVTKYNLEALVRLLFNYGQGLGDFLNQSSIYVMKNFGLQDVQDLKTGFLTSARGDNSEVYQAARAWLGEANLLLQSTVVRTSRGGASANNTTNNTAPAEILVSTPAGLKLIRAKRIVLTIPPILDNLNGWDLDAEEQGVFSQLNYNAYYTGVVNNTGLTPLNATFENAAVDTQYGLPVLPGIYVLTPAPEIPDAFGVKYGSPVPLPEEQVKADIVQAIKIAQKARNITATEPHFMVFASHTPFEMTVPPEAIADGFYRRLYALQDRNRMFYTGATFHTQDSSLLWQFTESLLPRIVQST